jgi:hypothetical protein
MFIYSLPLFFTYTGLGQPIELLAIIIILWVALLISTPFPDTAFEDRHFDYSLFVYFLYASAGQLSLSRVFFPFFILLNIGFFMADYQTKAGEMSISSWDDVHFMFFLPSILWLIAVWRSSANTTKRIWAASARLASLLVFLEYGLKILIRIRYSSVFFECQEKMLDYMSCF